MYFLWVVADHSITAHIVGHSIDYRGVGDIGDFVTVLYVVGIARLAKGGLRDALSVLDQVTAFGAGTVTAARVREVLGLVGDEVFAELLGIVAERRAAEAFPFVARLIEAGVDIVAFAEGAADLWRAALAARVGAKPDGISSTLAAEIGRRAGAMAAGDLLRILRSLEESEEAITRGQSPRLVLETLLVRWAMMDRTVEIAELIKGVGGWERGRVGGQESERSEERRAAPVIRDVAPARALPQSTPLPRSHPQAALSLASVRNAWPVIIDTLRSDRKMIAAETLGDVEVESVQGDAIVLKPRGGNPLTAETIGRYRAAIEAAAGKVLGGSVRIALVGEELPEGGQTRSRADAQNPPGGSPVRPSARPPQEGAGPPAGDAPKAQRLTASGAKAERAKALRGKDPALDRAMDAMDLELLE